MYLIHHYQNHLELNMRDEIDLDICLFLFVDASNLPENLIEQLIPISELPIFQMPKLVPRIYQLLQNAKQFMSDITQHENPQQTVFHPKKLSDNDGSLNSHKAEVNETKENSNQSSDFDSSTIITKSSLSHFYHSSFTISANICSIEDSVFSQCYNLQKFFVEPNNAQFISIEWMNLFVFHYDIHLLFLLFQQVLHQLLMKRFISVRI